MAGARQAIRNARVGAQVGRELKQKGWKGKVTRSVVKKTSNKPGNKAFKAGLKVGKVRGVPKKK